MNKKGLTLIELLGVIIVLGIIAAISFPAINGVINNTRKDAAAQNANAFVESAVRLAEEQVLVEGNFSKAPVETKDNTEMTVLLSELITINYLETDFDGDSNSKVVLGISSTNQEIIVKSVEFTSKDGKWVASGTFADTVTEDYTFNRNDITDK
jgi:prepilin-type N-terminal cleavage/methylation domain-containing protein